MVIAYYSRLWSPVLKVARLLRQQMPTEENNWLSAADLAGILALDDFEVVRTDYRQILPKRLLGLGPLVNRFLGPLPGCRRWACAATPSPGRWATPGRSRRR